MDHQNAAGPTTETSESTPDVDQPGSKIDNAHTPKPTDTQRSLGSREIRIDAIRHDPELQMRDAGVDVGIVAEYADAMNAGVQLPPIIVYFDGESYWPADGFHRIAAANQAGRETIEAQVHGGGKREAMLHAVGVNASHGLRRTAADKRRAIVAMLRDPQWSKWSDREIGKRCVVDHKTVAKVRAELTGEFPSDGARTYTTKHGTTATMAVTAKPNVGGGTMVERVLAQVSNEALIAECRRRKLEVAGDED